MRIINNIVTAIKFNKTNGRTNRLLYEKYHLSSKRTKAHAEKIIILSLSLSVCIYVCMCEWVSMK